MAISVCVVGASGLVGRELVAQLCDDPRVATVQLMLRRALNTFGNNPKISQHVIDFEQIAAVEWPACEVMCCCLGTTIKVAGSQQAFRRVDFDYVVESAKKARQAGATRLLVVSAMGANPDSRIFYNRVKGEMEAAVASLGYNSVTIFRPSFLSGERLEKRPGEGLALSALKVGNLFLPKKYQSVPAHAVARTMLKSLQHASRGVQIVESDEMQRNIIFN
ncbi:MAG TPA: oxidoreductase [Burkholderiaceae bacterium]|nr:oxidoreductase [Burkholderiaceae bacterium]